MPIKVKYDGDISALAQLALSSGATKLPQSRTPVVRGGGGGGRGGSRGGRGARGGGRAGLAQEISGYYSLLRQEAEQQQLEREVELEKENWEWKHDITAKKKQNEYRRVLSFLDSPEAEEQGFDPLEIEALKKEAWANLTNVPLTAYYKEPDVLNDGLPPEQQNGAMFRHESGAWGTYKIDRSSGRRFFDATIQFKDTPDGIQQTIEAKQKEAMMKGVLDYAKQEVAAGVDKEGIPQTRLRSADEIRDYYERLQEALAPATPTKEISRGVAQSTEWDVVRSFARKFKTQIRFNADEQAMPEPVAVSSSLLRLAKRRGDKWLGVSGHRQAIQAAYQILKAYHEAQAMEMGQ